MTPRDRVPRLAAAAFWTVVVALLLAMPGDSIPDPGPFDWLDKPVHALLFGVHYVLLAGAVAAARAGDRYAAPAALGSGLFALLMEAVQLGVPGRGWEWWDVAAGVAGIAVAALILERRRARL